MFEKLIPWKKSGGFKVRRTGEVVDGFHNDADPLIEFRRGMDRIWNRFWDDLSDWPANHLSRGIEVEDKADRYVLHAELPGFSPDDIDVTIRGNTMSLRAEHKASSNAENGSSYQYSSFFESFTLPAGLNTDKVDARFDNGLLEVHLPKNEDCRPHRIAVQAR